MQQHVVKVCIQLVVYKLKFLFIYLYKDALQFVRMQLFQNGMPVQSTVALTQDLFKYAGELMAVSILQGGPAPNYFSPAIYEVIAIDYLEQISMLI